MAYHLAKGEDIINRRLYIITHCVYMRTTNGRPYKEWDDEGAVPCLFPLTYYFLPFPSPILAFPKGEGGVVDDG